jgi:hypothetical protein
MDDPQANIQQYPTIAMGRYGQNPYGENLYRIIFAPSRYKIILGTNPDGSHGSKSVKVYSQGQFGNNWVLERWRSAEDETKVSRTQWDRQFAAILGPWPERGNYCWAYTFDGTSVIDANLDKLISWLEMSRFASYQDHRDQVQAAHDADVKERDRQLEDILRDKVRAFPGGPLSSAHVSRGTKTWEPKFSANQMHLPTKAGKFIAGGF